MLSQTTAYMKSYGRPVCISFGKCRRLFDSGAAFAAPSFRKDGQHEENTKLYQYLVGGKVLYSINDFKLPFPITFTQMAWFVVSVFAVMLLGNLPPLSFIDGAFLKYFGVPFALTWFMCQKTFDGKKPYGFLKSVLAYLVRPKLTYAGKPVKLEKDYPAQPITAVRSDIYGISD